MILLCALSAWLHLKVALCAFCVAPVAAATLQQATASSAHSVPAANAHNLDQDESESESDPITVEDAVVNVEDEPNLENQVSLCAIMVTLVESAKFVDDSHEGGLVVTGWDSSDIRRKCLRSSPLF